MTESDIAAAAIEWYKCGERLTAEHKKPKEKRQYLHLNRAYTEAQLKLCKTIEDHLAKEQQSDGG